MEIIGMTKEQLLGLHPDSLQSPGEPPRLLTPEEIVYMAETLGALWRYNYDALKQGRTGLHAKLKSLLHSDGFFVSRILLESWNIRLIIADQQVLRFRQLGIPSPNWVAGIPDGATELGKEVARILGVKEALMEKKDGRISVSSQIPEGETILLVEDFCTRGTGFTEAVQSIWARCPSYPRINILPYELVIINRGSINDIRVSLADDLELVAKVVPVVNYRVTDWKPDECPLCQAGSEVIEPKKTDENWRRITTSQL